MKSVIATTFALLVLLICVVLPPWLAPSADGYTAAGFAPVWSPPAGGRIDGARVVLMLGAVAIVGAIAWSAVGSRQAVPPAVLADPETPPWRRWSMFASAPIFGGGLGWLVAHLQREAPLVAGSMTLLAATVWVLVARLHPTTAAGLFRGALAGGAAAGISIRLISVAVSPQAELSTYIGGVFGGAMTGAMFALHAALVLLAISVWLPRLVKDIVLAVGLCRE